MDEEIRSFWQGNSTSFLECVLPVWRGTQAIFADQLELRPFTLEVDEHGYLEQTVLSNEVEALYASDTYTFITPPPGNSHWADQLAAPFLTFIHERLDLRGKTVIDIGGGSTALAHSLVNGSNAADLVCVVDPAVQTKSSEEKIRVIRDYWSAKSLTREDIPKPDVIISGNCFEHVLDPRSFLNTCFESLGQRGGDLILVFPDVDSAMRNGDWNVLLHEHVSYFNIKSATSLLLSAGFEVIHNYTNQDTLYLHARPVENSPQLVERSRDKEGYSFQPFELTLKHFQNRMREALKVGEVGFVGATNGLNTLLYLGGLAGDPRIHVYDGDDFKLGRFLPTVPSPIRSTKDPRLSEEGKIFVSALTFYAEIRESLLTDFGIRESSVESIHP